ncbi:MAG: hypothetical protein ACLSA6_06160 [Holdemania massiliensis]
MAQRWSAALLSLIRLFLGRCGARYPKLEIEISQRGNNRRCRMKLSTEQTCFELVPNVVGQPQG